MTEHPDLQTESALRRTIALLADHAAALARALLGALALSPMLREVFAPILALFAPSVLHAP